MKLSLHPTSRSGWLNMLLSIALLLGFVPATIVMSAGNNVAKAAPTSVVQMGPVNTVTASLATSSTPPACTKLVYGPGFRMMNGKYLVQAGVYWCTLPSGKVIAIDCIDPVRNAMLPNAAKLTTMGSLGGTTATSWKASRALQKYGILFDKGGTYGTITTNNNERAAAFRAFILQQAGHGATAKLILDRLHTVGKDFYTKVKNDAYYYSGPYTVSQKLVKASVFGPGSYSVVVKSAKGKPMSGLKVTFAFSGATPTSTTKTTSSTGTATATFSPTSFAKVSMSATVKGLTDSHVVVRWASGYWDTRQRFVGPSVTTKKVSTSYTPAVPSITAKGYCPGCTDEGVIKIASPVPNTGHGTAVMYVGMQINGTISSTWYEVQPGASLDLEKASWKAKGYFVAYPVVKFVKGTSTVTKVLTSKVEQDCLPWPEEQAGWKRNCTSATISMDLPAQSYSQHLVLVVDGVSHTFDAAAGQPLTATLADMPCAVDHTWTAQSSGTNRLGQVVKMWSSSGTLDGTAS